MKMSSCRDECEEDFIEIEVNFGVFEFPISSDKPFPISSPADELFYKGRVLSRHRPSHLSAAKGVGSGKISPCDSFNVSRVVEPRNFLVDRSSRSGFGNEESKKSVRGKIRQSLLGLKFFAYMKKHFTNASSSDKSSLSVATLRIARERSAVKESPTQAKKIRRDVTGTYYDDTAQGLKLCQRRKSFSETIKQVIIPKCSTPPNRFSFSSQVNEYQYLKRRDSETSEIEKSIQGAIAYCKQSQSHPIASPPSLFEKDSK